MSLVPIFHGSVILCNILEDCGMCFVLYLEDYLMYEHYFP